MKVTPVQGEPTTFLVEGRTLVCSRRALDRRMGCAFKVRFSRFGKKSGSTVKAGDPCPNCGKGVVEHRTYTVELHTYHANGKCSCDDFDFNRRKEVERMTKDERLATRSRCAHILAAREHALDAQLLEFAGRPDTIQNDGQTV